MEGSRPEIILSAAMSLDGKIATHAGDSALSSGHDLARLHRLRSETDAILVGSKTLLRDNPRLTVRHARGPNPVRIVLDSAATMSSDAAMLQTSRKWPVIVAVSDRASASDIRRLKESGADVIRCGQDRVELRCLLDELAQRRIRSLLVEGGGTTNWSFVHERLFDRVIVTVSPRLVGGSNAATLLDGTGFAKISDAAPLHLDKTEQDGDELVLYYSRA